MACLKLEGRTRVVYNAVVLWSRPVRHGGAERSKSIPFVHVLGMLSKADAEEEDCRRGREGAEMNIGA